MDAMLAGRRDVLQYTIQIYRVHNARDWQLVAFMHAPPRSMTMTANYVVIQTENIFMGF